MASRTESTVVNVAGLVQGVVLVTFPAASTIFTSKSFYGLSSTLYGDMFLPQVAMAIVASLVGARIAVRMSTKGVYVLGLSANLASMALLLGSVPVQTSLVAAYPLLLAATGLVGTGFGLTVPVLITITSAFHPDRVSRSVLVLNAMLGLGTVLAPVLSGVFVGFGYWWGLPILSALLLVVLLLVSVRLRLKAGTVATAAGSGQSRGIPARFWYYAAFAVLYGICETMNGNWSQLEMTTRLGASAAQASLALTAFWGMATAGRVLFAAIGRFLAVRVTYHILPFVLVTSFLLTSVLPHNAAVAGIAVFGLAGLGCSALLPLTISFGEGDLTRLSAAIPGEVIAFFQVGYGIAAFGTGPLQNAGLSLSAIFGLTAIFAAAMALLSFVVARRRPPRPGPTAAHVDR
jgi:predicted MFS family arabinose efflux permease